MSDGSTDRAADPRQDFSSMFDATTSREGAVDVARVVIGNGTTRDVLLVADDKPARQRMWSARIGAYNTGPCRSRDEALKQASDTLIAFGFDVRERLLPGDPTRAELIAERDRLRADLDAIRALAAPSARA